MTAARLVARCVRGLEAVLADEILQLRLGVVTRLAHREVRFRADGPARPAAVPRTADDLFLLAARSPDIGTARREVAGLAGLAAAADLTGTPDAGGGAARAAGAGIEVSASFLGRRDFNRYDVEDAVGEELARRLGVAYHSRRHGSVPPAGCLAWRVVLDGEQASLMVRTADRPLHRRGYKRHTIPGTLHPPVAAAMARLAGIGPGHLVVDPCCGAGTILIEAALAGPAARLSGFDADPAALRAARANAAGLPGVTFRPGDAGRLPLPAGAADRIVCNPPWGGQVGGRGLLGGSLSRWWAELVRVLAPGGQAVVLVPDPAGLATAIRHGLDPVEMHQVRVSGALSYLVRLVPRR
ncbi:hypothetical protein Sru01_24810 [Sphaerisporangium rufum]|uniref:Ribosomal RNA large subunit methyltransferase K/L-like methyltransferase domain-containing protein n=1 Tax=Sphaerisporangium rufum TaxID=1381558 RepID=A0A919R0F6_9ACTN|nr:methyltransferase domain-containing protein [Sphaerisporangium rufum]GII77499.1 hypothetical protein Sru01_24810 [Sphaerisporangium rufum]